MNIELLRKRGWIIFECISGSHAYGLNIEGSDVDIRGVYTQPTEMVLRDEYIEQVSDSTNDTTFYEIGRFIELLEKGNPNMLELLNVDDEHIIYKSELFDRYFPAEDIAAGRGIVVKRPNRDYLLSIRNGEVKYEDLLEKAEQLIEKIKDAFDSTNIPKSVSKSFIRDLLYKIRVEEWER